MQKNLFQDRCVFEKESFISEDENLKTYSTTILDRYQKVIDKEAELCGSNSLESYANGYMYYGLHKANGTYVFRESAPNAISVYLIGDFNSWKIDEEYRFKSIANGDWELVVDDSKINEGDQYLLHVFWAGGNDKRIPSYARRVVQDKETTLFNAVICYNTKYKWKYPKVKHDTPLIYELHIGMSGEKEGITTIKEFRKDILPYIANTGYNTIQLMAIQEHPYYGSYGYHVSNFYAVSSKFGNPEELMELVDEAHTYGLAVIIDIVHSHSIKNEMEGLANFDGNPALYFHEGKRRLHKSWDSLCFDYSKDNVLHFLLSNCKYWMEEYNIDGFRFDGVTSMLYYHHGLQKDFTSYNMYYDGNQDEDAIVYLALANKLIHQIYPDAITIAEEMSGMPGICSPLEKAGYGFDYRMAMGIPDYWIKIIKENKDEYWHPGDIFFNLTNKRNEEYLISYCESHDQALVGDKTIIFRLIGEEMYSKMSKFTHSHKVDRGMALHKIIRLMTFGTSTGGYLNFMGNEFGHPEWIDFPRKGNDWSYKYARRQWSLAKDTCLKYHLLSDFDNSMLEIEKSYPFVNNTEVRKIFDNPEKQLLAFTRGDLLFVFNINPEKSFEHLDITVIPGKYKIILNTDDKEFGGNGIVDDQMIYYSSGDKLKIYLPARTGIVFNRLKTKTVY